MRLALCILAVMVGTIRAETIWVAQTAAGADTGADTANAHSAAWFNTSANWGMDAGDITAGDTVMLAGTITNTLTIYGSGTNGGPITIQFAAGAKLSKPTWGTGGAIAANGKHYINISGGTIESTANGGGLANQVDDHHFDIRYSTNWNIVNLSSLNAYVANQSAPDTNSFGEGIYALGMSSLNVSNCVFANGGKVLFVGYTAGNSNITVQNCTVSNIIVGITIGSSDVGSTLDGVAIKNNTVNIGTNWWGSWTEGSTVWHHTDCIHLYAVHSGTWMTNVVVSGNRMGPDNPKYDVGGTPTSNVSSFLYLEGQVGPIYSPVLVNNVLTVVIGAGNGPSLGFIGIKGTTGALVANNTILSTSGRNGIYLFSTASGARLWNNIIVGGGIGIYDDASTNAVYDCNLYSSNTYAGRLGATYCTTLADWRTALGGCPGVGNECSGLSTNPVFVSSSDFRLQSSSPAIGAGTNLNAYFTTDLAGTTRGATWDIGAYQYAAGEAPPPDTNNPTCTISTPADDPHNNGTTGTAAVSGTASDDTVVSSVTWSNSLGGSGTATGTTSWNATVSLTAGTNLLTFTAHDVSGNTGTDSVRVVYSGPDTNTPPASVGRVMRVKQVRAGKIIFRGK